MDSTFIDPSGAATSRKKQKRRRRSIEQESAPQFLQNDAGGSGFVANLQNTDGTSTGSENEPPVKRARFNYPKKGKSWSRKQIKRVGEGETEQRMLRSSTRACKDAVLSTAVDRITSEKNVSFGMQHRSTCSGKCSHGKHKNASSQDRNSSLDFHGTPPKRSLFRTATAHCSSEIPPSPDYVRIVQQMEADENLARSLQAQYDTEVQEQPQPVAAEGNHTLHSSGSGTPGVMSTEQTATTSQQSDDLRAPQRRHRRNGRGSRSEFRAGSRMMSPLRVVSGRPSSLEYLLDTEAAIDEIGLSFPITSLLNIMNPDVDSISITLRRINQDFQSFSDLLRGSLDLDSGLNSRGLTTAQINRLPTRNYQENGTSDHGEAFQTSECQICLSTYEEGVTLRTLQCFHEFHRSCIDKWLKINQTCPVCRALVGANSSDQ